MRTKVQDLVAIGAQHCGNFIFIFEAGVIGAKRNLHAQALRATLRKAPRVKLACSSSSFDQALKSGRLTQLEFLDLAARELRADGAVLDVRHFPRTDDDYLAQIKKMAADTGLTIAAISSDEFFGADEQRMRDLMHVAVATGAPLLTGRLSAETAMPWSTQLERLSTATSIAKKQNVTLAVRNAPTTFAATTADCKRVAKESDSAWLRFGIEPSAMDAASDLAAIADRTVLLWVPFEPPLPGAWRDFIGFAALDRPTGDASLEEMKIATRAWRTAISQLNRT